MEACWWLGENERGKGVEWAAVVCYEKEPCWWDSSLPAGEPQGGRRERRKEKVL